jgi:hypothetical protein
MNLVFKALLGAILAVDSRIFIAFQEFCFNEIGPFVSDFQHSHALLGEYLTYGPRPEWCALQVSNL